MQTNFLKYPRREARQKDPTDLTIFWPKFHTKSIKRENFLHSFLKLTIQ